MFVVRQDALGELGIEAGEGSEHVGAPSGVGGDRATLVLAQLLPFVNDVEESLVDLADVVKEGDALDAAEGPLVPSRGISDDERVVGDASDVGPGLGVVGVDGVEERLERRGGHAFGRSAGVPLVQEEGAEAGADGDGSEVGHGG